MGDKVKISLEQITFSEGTASGKKEYKVISLANTTSYNIGEVLKEEAVHDLCNITPYEVTIK
jgi:hypothetical protein